MPINYEAAKTLIKGLVQKMKSFRGNWEQNDPTADDYIKNRPFYSEVKEITIIDTIVNFDNSSSNMVSSGPTIYQAIIEDSSVKSFKIGETYTVIWDDQTYECVAQDISGIGAIGNASLIGYMGSAGYEDTGEPFLIGAEQGYGYIVFSTENGNHTLIVKTITEVIKKLDNKFIDMPDDIVTDEDLQELNNSINEMYSNVESAINEIDSNMESTYNSITNHTTNKNNPHNVTAAQIDAAHIKHIHPYLQYLDTDTIMPKYGDWNSIAYGNGIFVAILYGGGAAYSKDGITWTEVTTPVVQDRALISIAYGNGKFVAVAKYATSNIIIYSTDGIIWNTTEISTKADWDIIKYGNGKFVATARVSDKLIYSEDGINWTEVTLSSSGWWIDIAYGNGKFIIIDQFLSKTAISEDGITWNVHTTSCGSLDTYYAGPLTYYNGKFIALRNIGNAQYGF